MENYIAKLRKQNKLTQQALADILHVSNKTISKWENNRGLPDISLIEPLSNALAVTPLELLRGEDIGKRVNKSLNLADVIKYNKECLIYKKEHIKRYIKLFLLFIFIISFIIFDINFVRVNNYNKEPLFLVNNREEYIRDESSNYLIKEYKGLCYKWTLKGSLSDIDGNSIILNKDNKYHFIVEQKYLDIFNINIYSSVVGVSQYNMFDNIIISLPFMSLLLVIISIVLYYIFGIFVHSRYLDLILLYFISFLTILLLFYINGLYNFDMVPSKLVIMRIIIFSFVLSIFIKIFYIIICKLKNHFKRY